MSFYDQYLKISAACLIPVLLTSCGLGPSEDDSTQAKIQRDNEKLMQVFSTVAGVYQGTVTLGNRAGELPAKIYLYTIRVGDGVDGNGASKSRVEQRAQLRFDRIGDFDDHTFTVDLQKSGDVFLTQSSANVVKDSKETCSVGQREPALNIRGSIIDGTLAGSLGGPGGEIGSLRMKKSATQVTVPALDQAERLAAAFQRISGTYGDTILSSSGVPLKTSVVIRAEQVSVGTTGLWCPALKAYVKYEQAMGLLNDTSFDVNYRESIGDLVFTYNGNTQVGACTTGPIDTKVKLEATLAEDQLNGKMTGALADYGAFHMKKVSTNTKLANDQFNRLKDAYEPIAGTYGGTFKGTVESFPVKLVISLVVKSPSAGAPACPKLQGLYMRPGLYAPDPTIGMIGISVDYFPHDSHLYIKNSETGAGLPGNSELSIHADWSPTGFLGDMSWYNQFGTLSVIKCRGPNVDEKGTCAGN